LVNTKNYKCTNIGEVILYLSHYTLKYLEKQIFIYNEVVIFKKYVVFILD